jgi:hypothetical protein
VPLFIHKEGPRFCLHCAAARLPRTEWGSWTWGFGDCVCGHFGYTTLAANINETVERRALLAHPEKQAELFGLLDN